MCVCASPAFRARFRHSRQTNLDAGQFEQAILKNNLPMTIAYVGYDDAADAANQIRHDSKRNLIFAWYVPSELLRGANINEFSQTAWLMKSFERLPMHKLASPGLRLKAPDADHLLQSFDLSLDDYNVMAELIAMQGDHFDAACN